MSAFALAVIKAQAEDAIKMLINRRKSDFFIKTSVGGVAGGGTPPLGGKDATKCGRREGLLPHKS